MPFREKGYCREVYKFVSIGQVLRKEVRVVGVKEVDTGVQDSVREDLC